ncbi:hypothetical protein A5819_001071 [Enterococcus sp. 7E2_DIV0204]|uniref:MucBP domain-containing protein n=1 Tax=unclassified Enterococcus TaxID=2608891 RepID=UPI000A354F85|nr:MULTISPECIES: MucBP domain-containing protein [unclassified Enterococcus]OTN88590.1 hypothetical protein A5819_001071 [Enterococcus sp. 7E2_DIV0204]OTP51059.1 hypothetical protein A5884_000245 [Enterococcus sp. 7D2_DIV0200]
MNNAKKIFLPSMICLGIYTLANLPIEATAINQDEPMAMEHTPSSESATYNSSLHSSSPDLPFTRATSEIVSVPDKVLRETILIKLGKSTDDVLTKQDMESLTSLTITNATSIQINSLAGLEFATNLGAISLDNNNVGDFTPLEQLTSLVFVSLSGNFLTSSTFPDLSKSTGITHISVTSRQLDNEVFSKFTTLMNLERLYLDKNMFITTLEPLKHLPKLRSISVQFCGITDFTVINDFPALNDLAAFGQNTGRTSLPVTMSRSTLGYDATQQTVFIPFVEMPNRITNFDGYVPPFTTSTSASNTVLEFNDAQLPEDRLQITDLGITVSAVTEEDFHNLASITYNARINNPVGNYETPPNFSFYAISAGTYFQQFNVIDEPEDGAPVTVKYQDEAGQPISESTVLEGKIDASFTAVPKDINTWVLKSTAGNTEGTFTQNPQEIIFTYERALGEPVMVYYTDTQGKPLAEPETLQGQLDTPYTSVSKQITGWQLKELPRNASGSFTNQAQTVHYMYKKIEKPLIPLTHSHSAFPTEYFGYGTNPIISSITHIVKNQVDVSEVLKEALELPTWFPNTLATTEKTSDSKETVQQQAKEKQTDHDGRGSVTIKFVDEQGNELTTPSTITGKIGESYRITAKKVKKIN